MGICYFDDQIDDGLLSGKTIAVIGYGNQGRSQALNLRDSGHRVIIGNRDDEYRNLVRADEMPLFDIDAASAQADIVMLVIPDEAQPQVFQEQIQPNLRTGSALCLSHGYNIYFNKIQPRNDLDVILVAPKMIGQFVRSHYVDGDGFASLVAVAQDGSGKALQIALALAKGMGGARRGAWLSTFEEETVTDLFGEQVGGASALQSTIYAFETLVEAGFDPDVVALELYGSGELSDVMKGITRYGMLNSLFLHSPASRYGQLSRAKRMVPEEAKETLRSVLDDIRSGRFADELSSVADADYRRVDELLTQYGTHGLFRAEARVRAANAGRSPDTVVESAPRPPWEEQS